jgi:protein SCO1
MKLNKPNTSQWRSLFLPFFLLIFILGFLIYQNLSRKIDTKGAQVDEDCASRAYAEIGGPFNLINQDGQKVTQDNYKNKPALVYFGYTYCPDVCPNSLMFMSKTLETLSATNPEIVAKIQPILITIDPARDTPARLKEYVTTPGFPKGLIGLSGNQKDVEAAAKAYKVAYKKNDNKDDPTAYTMDHSSIIYLLGADGKLKTFFSDVADPQKTAQCIATLNKNGL